MGNVHAKKFEIGTSGLTGDDVKRSLRTDGRTETDHNSSP